MWDILKWSEPWAENKNLLRSMKPDELGFSAQNSILDKIIVPFCLVHFSRQVVNLNHSKIVLWASLQTRLST
jgi:hypothetical protein